MLKVIVIWIVCFIFWLLLSGYFDTPLLLGFGILSSALAAFIAWRAEQLDPEQPAWRLKINSQFFLYPLWLIWQIILSNLDVAKRILDPKLPISPTMITLKPTQHSAVLQVIYANSITLTPGTITTVLQDGVLEVHALTAEAADSLLAGDMDRRVTALEMEQY